MQILHKLCISAAIEVVMWCVIFAPAKKKLPGARTTQTKLNQVKKS